ncbi:MAG: hypothetical protein E6Y14_05825 [Haemophilus parainfluenzae]|jgi:hypothetical protein|nr:hypothetical protein [Haemophilus parainfluenzae]MDU4702314.1 hypothetical protein [Haemophilus parainfluenzae]MDU5638945.1 hypothetical protein [Haemophilus parainfluenzae]MDU5697999.1 hypothetical protein [Haemophilus parainfluenzae]
MVDVIPKLFITGSEYRIIVTDRSCDDLCDSNQLSKDELSFNKIKWIHSLDSTRLIANMFRYANGQSLNIPKYLNDERPPFWAFKDKTPPPNESFDQFREKAQNDISIFNKMKQLRAYFWYEIKYLNKHYEEENLIILSHFIIKETAMMTEEDVHICRNQKHKFDMIQGEKYA